MNKFTQSLKSAYKFFAILAFSILILPSLVFAHQPRITEGRLTQVTDPEISKAYYGQLTGAPDVYVINADTAFDLYVGILVPDVKNPNKDVSAEIRRGDVVLANIGGTGAEWKTFFEPFGQSTYWDGGEYKIRAAAGTYNVVVNSTNNDSKYSLAVGEIEAFDQKEGMNALGLIPELKKDFFEESPISFIKSPFGWGMIVVMYILAFIFGFIFRFVLKFITKKFGKNNAGITGPKNINRQGRLIRAVIGIALLLLAILTTWSLILIFISGFCIFESLFSWCAFNQMIGKNTCDVE